jgi:hypothetical protein
LAVDADLASKKVDAVDREPEALALPQAGAGGEDDKGPVASVAPIPPSGLDQFAGPQGLRI